ncbi:MAG: rhodanese-related sulfurtransferase [Oceanicoccus sp.]|jgi:rhodanese-related sulfurtransferase
MRQVLHAALLALILFPQVTLAIPPPELIINIGAQVAAVASVVALFLSAAFTTGYQLLKAKLSTLSKKHWIVGMITAVLLTTLGSGIGAHFYFQYESEEDLENWYEESKKERTEILLEDWPEEEIEEEIEEENTEPSFFELHAGEANVISNTALAEALNGDRDDYILLDARENLEIEAGRIPGATNIRLADLLSGEWKNLDENKYIYVICASAMRGEEVSNFLREKELLAQHLEEGAQSWVEEGYDFDGTIVFSEYYTNWYYHRYFSNTEVRSHVADGALLIDSREPAVYAESGLLNSIYIALLYTPTEDLEESFAQVPLESSVITVCDDWINCFDAKMVGIELERRGYNYLGRYNKPDEY